MNKSNKLGFNKLIIKTANRRKIHLHEEFNANTYHRPNLIVKIDQILINLSFAFFQNIIIFSY